MVIELYKPIHHVARHGMFKLFAAGKVVKCCILYII